MKQISLTEFKSELLSEAQVSLGLAIPLAIAQLAEAGIPVVNSVMMGLLGTQNLAAGALGTITFVTLLVVCVGTLTAGGALAAEAFGAKEIDRVSRITSGGLWLAIAISLPAILVIWNCSSILPLLGQEESNVALTKSYLHALVWGLPAALCFLHLKRMAAAINFPQFGIVIIVTSLLLNVPANYVLMFGYLGFPALGLAGIGWGTTLIYWVSFLASAMVFYFHPKSRDYKLFRNLNKFDPELFIKIFQTGWPMGIQLGMQLGLFMVTAWLMGSLGTETLAGHEIAIQTSDLFLTIPVGVSSAVTTRVGQMMGEKNALGAIRAVFVNIAFYVLFATLVALGFELFSQRIAAIYLDINNPDNAVAITQAISFLKLAAVYQLSCGIQIIGVGALLGLQDTRVPMLINILIFWGIGLGGGYLMTMILGCGGIGYWYGLILATAISGIILIVRFYVVNFKKISNSEVSSYM
ncbi:MATE family efflux transporter [Desmonostoc muscorum LEGE 12446]|uniref:Probable multidrug resistance protein NorM n=1 Tax=Desmonostoc muscorum LEGE 12446 TaxID=1828758 RepID=A0A8J7A2W9_DESMC|nr:MATE family efflux transporter [Desmonostoc muscorum]MCF2149950.1 MATE family efflux transporter [Desmonostoc muscorum LEGE 12446]